VGDVTAAALNETFDTLRDALVYPR